MHPRAQKLIESLGLAKHPEGGYFRETYRSGESIVAAHLPARFGGDRVFSTAIYFLLTGNDVSAFHRIKQDELWHFHEGGDVLIHGIDDTGALHTKRLGLDIENGAEPQATIPAGWIFGAEVAAPDGYALVSCTVAPGFDFADFELISRFELLEAYPDHAAVIQRLTGHPFPA